MEADLSYDLYETKRFANENYFTTDITNVRILILGDPSDLLQSIIVHRLHCDEFKDFYDPTLMEPGHLGVVTHASAGPIGIGHWGLQDVERTEKHREALERLIQHADGLLTVVEGTDIEEIRFGSLAPSIAHQKEQGHLAEAVLISCHTEKGAAEVGPEEYQRTHPKNYRRACDIAQRAGNVRLYIGDERTGKSTKDAFDALVTAGLKARQARKAAEKRAKEQAETEAEAAARKARGWRRFFTRGKK
ncbi:hypothetical protein CC79DRAFT_73463 [Sarocladium strictum]